MPTSKSGQKPLRRKRQTLVSVHEFIRVHEGDRAASDWLVSTVSNLSDQLAAQKRELTTLKTRVTRLENEKRHIDTSRLSLAELARLRATDE